jgi:hypothetical protein
VTVGRLSAIALLLIGAAVLVLHPWHDATPGANTAADPIVAPSQEPGPDPWSGLRSHEVEPLLPGAPVEMLAPVVVRSVASWTGVVLDTRGEPVGGALVGVLDDPAEALPSAWPLVLATYDRREGLPRSGPRATVQVTDAEGRFDVTPGSGRFVVQHPAYAPWWLAESGTAPPTEILLRDGTTLTGLVVGTSADELDGAYVRYDGPARGGVAPCPTQLVAVAPDGAFTLTAVSPGRGRVLLHGADDRLLARQVLHLEASERRRITMAVTAPSSVSVVVPGSEAALRRLCLRHMVSADETWLTRSGPEWSGDVLTSGSYAVMAESLTGSSYTLGTVDVLPGANTFTLQLPASALRLLLDVPPDAFPLRVYVRRADKEGSGLLFALATLDTPAREYRVASVPPGDYSITLESRSPTMAEAGVVVLTHVGRHVAVGDGEVVVRLSYQLRRLQVDVVDDSGAAAAGVLVVARVGGRTLTSQTTDDHGTCVLLLNLHDACVLSARARDDPTRQSAAVAVDDTVDTLRLTLFRLIRVRFRTADGTAFQEVSVSVPLGRENQGLAPFGGDVPVAGGGRSHWVRLVSGSWLVRWKEATGGERSRVVEVAEVPQQEIVL